MTTKSIIHTCLKEGNFTLHSGQKSKYLFDVIKLIDNFDFQQEFARFVDGDFLVGIEFGGSILAMLNGNENFAIIRKDGTIYGNKIPKEYVLIDDVITTENSVRTAITQLYKTIGYYPEEIKCVVDRRQYNLKSLHVESMLEFEEKEFIMDTKIEEEIKIINEFSRDSPTFRMRSEMK